MHLLTRLVVAAIACVCASSALALPSIEVVTSERRLYLRQEDGSVLTYRIAVGTPGEQWFGSQVVTRKAEWPSWRPTSGARRKHPGLPAMVPGGAGNPLGARALYLGSTLYRIHGTNQPRSIGRAASGGCFRMHNDDVADLYPRVPVGTVVTVR